MLHVPLIPPVDASRADDLAQASAIRGLIRCYCRELAVPAGLAKVRRASEVADLPLPRALAYAPNVLFVRLPPGNDCLLVGVAADSATQNYVFQTAVFLHRRVNGEDVIDAPAWEPLAASIYEATAALLDERGNDEIIDQTANSIAITGQIIARHLDHIDSIRGDDGPQDFLRSEQAMVFGHAFHPTPKSRQGVEEASALRYSPEARTPFDLDYFEIEADHLWQRAVPGEPATSLLARCLPAGQGGGAMLPVHPTQSGIIRAMPAIQKALQEGWLRYRGTIPKPYWATSSVRTLIHPADPYFLKLSLHVRLTNCIRKNAWYELDGAVAMTGILRERGQRLRALFPECRVLEEPASLSADAPGWPDEERRQLREALGLILRESPLPHLRPDETPLLAGALFAPAVQGEPVIASILRAARAHTSDAKCHWLRAYADRLIHPVLYAYFHEGLIFEPHLQNVLVSLSGFMPTGVYLRDFEGTKLSRAGEASPFPTEVSREALDALSYTPDSGWKRVSYCLFVNNLCQAVHHIAGTDVALERMLWLEVRESLSAFQRAHGTGESAMVLEDLLNGTSLPAKAGLITRWRRQPDREAIYVDMANPMGAR
jgi:siderophore synthetase component